jgi:hypothetical protein
MAWNAFQLGRDMVWPRVADAHAGIYSKLIGIKTDLNRKDRLQNKVLSEYPVMDETTSL